MFTLILANRRRIAHIPKLGAILFCLLGGKGMRVAERIGHSEKYSTLF
ncbi:hypothetical protein [Ralstonia sp. SET104]|nr:hypothetical protein [Ralstonia sp. SET104]